MTAVSGASIPASHGAPPPTAPPSAAPKPEVQARHATPAAAPSADGPSDPASVWSRFRASVAEGSVAPIVEPLTLERIEGGVAVVSAPTVTALGAARTRRGAIEEGISKALGRSVRLELRAADRPPEAAPTESPTTSDPAARAKAMSNPLVRRAVELFDGRVVEVSDDTPE